MNGTVQGVSSGAHPAHGEAKAQHHQGAQVQKRESTRFFEKVIPSLRADTQNILDRQQTRAHCILVPVCGQITCWWYPAQGDESGLAAAEHCAPSVESDVFTAKPFGHSNAVLANADAPQTPTACQKNPVAPVVFELHGGGFALGDARKDDAFCAALRDNLRVHVVAVNYPKAPEHPYPAAPEAVWQVLLWFAQNAARFGMDASRFAVLGFSSGGNLAAVTALRAVRESAPFTLAAQVLHYPFLDAATSPAHKNPQPWDLSAEVMDAFTELYCAGADPHDITISPACAAPEQLRGAAPAFVLTAGRDALQAEGEEYARLLQAAGCAVQYAAQPHAHHGYVEDWFNQACYEATPEDTRAFHDAQFGISAQSALDDSVSFLRCHLLGEQTR